MRFVHPSYAAALETQATWWRPLDLSSGRVLGLSAGGCRFDSRRGRPPHYLSGGSVPCLSAGGRGLNLSRRPAPKGAKWSLAWPFLLAVVGSAPAARSWQRAVLYRGMVAQIARRRRTVLQIKFEAGSRAGKTGARGELDAESERHVTEPPRAPRARAWLCFS